MFTYSNNLIHFVLKQTLMLVGHFSWCQHDRGCRRDRTSGYLSITVRHVSSTHVVREFKNFLQIICHALLVKQSTPHHLTVTLPPPSSRRIHIPRQLSFIIETDGDTQYTGHLHSGDGHKMPFRSHRRRLCQQKFLLLSVAPTTATRTVAPTAAPSGSPVAMAAPMLLDEGATGSASTTGGSPACAGGGSTMVAAVGSMLEMVAGARG